MTWEALYQVILTGTRAQVTGTATVMSQGLRADSADVQLVAGAIRRTRAPAAAPAPMMDRMRIAGVSQLEEKTDVGEEAVGETHVYQLPGRLSIEPNVPVTTALFPRSSAPVAQVCMSLNVIFGSNCIKPSPMRTL